MGRRSRPGCPPIPSSGGAGHLPGQLKAPGVKPRAPASEAAAPGGAWPCGRALCPFPYDFQEMTFLNRKESIFQSYLLSIIDKSIDHR